MFYYVHSGLLSCVSGASRLFCFDPFDLESPSRPTPATAGRYYRRHIFPEYALTHSGPNGLATIQIPKTFWTGAQEFQGDRISRFSQANQSHSKACLGHAFAWKVAFQMFIRTDWYFGAQQLFDSNKIYRSGGWELSSVAFLWRGGGRAGGSDLTWLVVIHWKLLILLTVRLSKAAPPQTKTQKQG